MISQSHMTAALEFSPSRSLLADMSDCLHCLITLRWVIAFIA